MSAFYLSLMKHLANLPICGSNIAVNMLSYFQSCMFNHCNGVLQHRLVVFTFYWKLFIISVIFDVSLFLLLTSFSPVFFRFV